MKNRTQFDWRDKDSTLNFLDGVLAMAPSKQTQVAIDAGSESLTRFAGNRIHQNVSETDCRLSIRTIEDGCLGDCSINQFDEKSVKEALDRAAEVARAANMPAEPPDFAGPQDYKSIDNYKKETAHFSPQERADMVAGLVEKCLEKGAEAAGAVSNSETILAIANTNGLRAHHTLTDSNFTATVSADGSTGWCTSYALRASDLQARKMGTTALERSISGKNPREIEPGRYTVILEEAAIKDFVDFLIWLGFGAQSFEEGRSFMCGKVGEKITGDNITIVDDAFDSLSVGTPFDYEGAPKRQVVMIDKGIARDVVYDRAHAARAGRDTTGHALPTSFTYGPLPLNVVVNGGDFDLGKMIRSVERGLLVSRFWYCRVVDPAKTLLTGQTRDGTFLIEDGEIVSGVKDMRFNESVLEAFARAEMISKDVRRIERTIVPAMKIADFRFTETVGD